MEDSSLATSVTSWLGVLRSASLQTAARPPISKQNRRIAIRDVLPPSPKIKCTCSRIGFFDTKDETRTRFPACDGARSAQLVGQQIRPEVAHAGELDAHAGSRRKPTAGRRPGRPASKTGPSELSQVTSGVRGPRDITSDPAHRAVARSGACSVLCWPLQITRNLLLLAIAQSLIECLK